MTTSKTAAGRPTPTSTVGRGRSVKPVAISTVSDKWSDEFVCVQLGDSLDFYGEWKTPTVIVSDGGYGVLGFEGDTSDHLDLPDWYRPHIAAWSQHATPATTLWFWNSEIGWAAVHPVLEANGWRYVNANIWNKGKGHIAGNVNNGSPLGDCSPAVLPLALAEDAVSAEKSTLHTSITESNGSSKKLFSLPSSDREQDLRAPAASSRRNLCRAGGSIP